MIAAATIDKKVDSKDPDCCAACGCTNRALTACTYYSADSPVVYRLCGKCIRHLLARRQPKGSLLTVVAYDVSIWGTA